MAAYYIKCILAVAVAVSLCGCSGVKANDKHHRDAQEADTPIVEFCQALDYTDTASLHSEKTMAGYMTDIVKLMNRSDSAATARALDIFLNGLDGDSLALRLASRHAYLYLGNPNSPVRDETLYLRFLASLLSRNDIPDDIAARAMDSRRRTMLNRRGTKANDFRYIDRDGKEGTLYGIEAPQTMLIFYDPECPHCPEILDRIAADRKVNAAIDAGELKVLAVYTEGKRDMWEKRKGELSERWTVACDLSEIIDGEIYDVPAMPTVYLLDSEKRVLVKDMLW